MASIKAAVREAFHSIGLDLQRHVPEATPAFRLLKSLQRFDIDFVIDVGANCGQFAHELRQAGYAHDILSFEPLPDAYDELMRAAARDPRWHVHERCAVGSRDGNIEINVAANSVSSSVLPMLDSHASAAPDSAYVRREVVPLVRLDRVLPARLGSARAPFLKIDTQGFESEVLDGTGALLREMRGVLCELSLVPLYENQQLWTEMIDRLRREGFLLWAIQTGFTDPRDGRTLQVDATFFRMDAVTATQKK